MKKILLFVSALAGLFLVGSCQREEFAPAGEGNVVTFEVGIPEVATKANAVVDNGTNINDLVYAVYRTSATTLEGAKADENVQLIYRKNYTANPFQGNTAVVPIELINDQNYLIVFWAQVDDAWVEEDSFDLMRIEYPVEMNANDSGLAAFTNVSFISKEAIKGGAIKKDITLTRPFAQIRIATTLPQNVIEDVVLTRSSVTVTGAAEAFNVLKQEPITGTGEEPFAAVFNLAEVPEGNIEVNNAEYKYAAMNYIFANGNVGVAFNIETEKHGTVTTESIPDVPVKRNYRTNIVGNLLTSEAKYNVTLDQDWGPEGPVDNDYVVTVANNAQDIQEAIESIPEGGSGEITLGGDIDLNDLSALIGTLSTKAASAPSSLIIPSEKAVILNLNGYTLTQTVDYAGHSMIVNNGNLTLKGEGTICYTYNGTPDTSNSKGNQTISNFGTLVLDGPTVENATAQMSHARFAIDTREGAICNIISGVVRCPNSMAIRMGQFGPDANVLNITGGHIYGARAVQVHLPSSSATVNPVMTLNVQGGLLESNDEQFNIGIYVISNGQSAENVAVTVGGEAQIKGNVLVNAAATNTMKSKAVKITGGAITGEVYSYSDDQAKADDVISVTGGTFDAEPNYVDEDYKYEEQNGKYVVIVDPVAKIGTTEYNTFEDAFRAANVGDTVTLLRDVRLSEELALPAGIIFNGNGKQINGTIYASGNLTFAGHTKVTAFSASYYNRTITIGESACLEVTGTGRVTLGYGNTFNITGNIDNAKTADKANIQPSLIIPGGISITGGNDAAMNVTNAYVKIGSTTSRNNAANGTFSLNFTNAIAEFTNQLTFAEPTSGMNPTFNVTVTNSVLTTGTKFIAAAPGSNVTIDNSEVTLATYFRNSGVWTLMNKSKLTGNTIQFGENGGNDGTTIVDGSEFVITGGSEGLALDGKGTGSIKLLNGATATIDYLKDMILDIAGGKLTVTKQINCVIQIAEGLTKDYQENIYYVSSAAGLEKMHEMFANQTAGKEAVLNLMDNIDFTGKTWTPVDSHADNKFTIKEINGNGHTISNLTIKGQAMFRRFAGTGDVVVKDITFDNATVNSSAINTSILTVQSYQNVLLDNVDVKNSSITGGYKVAPLIATVYNEKPSTTVTATLKDCDVENVEVKAVTYDFCTTGMVAFVNAGDNDAITFENCTINILKLIAPDDSYKAHAAIYTTGSGSLYNEADEVEVSNVTFETL